MTTAIQKWGNSQGVRIPKILLDTVNWAEDEQITIVVDNGKIIMQKAKSKRKNIKELFEDYKEEYEPTEIDIPGNENQEKLSPKVALSNRIKEELGEEFEALGYDLYKQVSKQNIQEAQDISDTFYEEHYTVKKGEEK